jgi:competence ComEA-like helix-hairpin-helix protein
VKNPPSDFAAALIVCALALVALARSDAGPRTPNTPLRTQARESPRPAAVKELREGSPLELNQATARDLVLLPGIGPKLAQRIVAERERRGQFASIEELRAVKGVGPAIFARVKPLVRVLAPATDRAPANP